MNRPLRIAIITTDARHWFRQFDSRTPNFGTAIQGLLQGFDGMEGVEIHVISASPSELDSPEMLGPNLRFHHLHVPKWGWGKTLFLGVVARTRKLVRTLDIDIVHGQGTERDCAVAAILSGRPNVLTIHGNMRVHAARGENGARLYYRIAAFLETLCLRRCGGVVAISRYTRELVKNLAPQTWLLPNAVDRRYFAVDPQPPVIPRLLFIGSLDERKNPRGLLEACSPLLQSGECTLTLIGQVKAEHPYVREVRALAESLPGVEIIGFTGRDELAEHFRRSSLLVLPTFEDNCPMVILEAMAAGLPVAASRVGGVPDLVEDGVDGMMFDPSEPADLRRVLEALVRDPEFRQRAGAAGRRKALAEFHPRHIAERHVAIYREVLDR
jgi:glycosyltransferase involved in cell wall biosynthesis